MLPVSLPVCWLGKVAQCLGAGAWTALFRAEEEDLCGHVSAAGKKMMPKSNPFFLPCCKMLSCVTNTVVEQGATELGDQAFCSKLEAERWGIYCMSSGVAQEGLSLLNPIIRTGLQQSCAWIENKWRSWERENRYPSLQSWVLYVSCHKPLWIWKGCSISFPDMLTVSWQRKQPFVWKALLRCFGDERHQQSCCYISPAALGEELDSMSFQMQSVQSEPI